MPGMVTKAEDGTFKVVFPFCGDQHEVTGIKSSEDACLVCNALTAKAAEELQGALEAVAAQLPAGTAGELPSLRLPLPPSAQGLPAASFGELVDSLQACIRSPLQGSWDDDEEDEEEYSPSAFCLLLAAAALLGSKGAAAARQLLLFDSAAAAERLHRWQDTAVHQAAEAGNAAMLALMLRAEPAAAAAVCDHLNPDGDDFRGWTVLHSAAAGGSADCVKLVLAAAPDSAHALTDYHDHSPLHEAAGKGHAEALEALLAAAPEVAVAADNSGQLAIDWAAAGGSPGHAAAVELLMQAMPESAKDAEGHWLRGALDCAAQAGSAATLRLLLQAVPEAARTDKQYCALLSAAARCGKAACLRLLLEAAPQAAGQADATGYTPLELVLQCAWYRAGEAQKLEAARCLIPHTPADSSVRSIAEGGQSAQPLFADAVVAHAPLTGRQWLQIPAPCPGLGRALPAALACSADQTSHLVARLPPADAARLRAFALALPRIQRRLGVFLPPDVSRLLLSRCLSA